MARPILYISGPYSAGTGRTVADNIAVARAYAVAAAKAGWMPLTPHLNTAHFEKDCPEISHKDWVNGDLEILGLLGQGRGAVLMLPGWEGSRGARLERDWAIYLNLEVFDPPEAPESIPPAAAFPGRSGYYYCDSEGWCSCDREACPTWEECSVKGRCR